MGLFNTVNIDLLCPGCNCIVDWQSKYMEYHGYMLANAMQYITLDLGMNGEVHTFCDECQLYLQYDIKEGKVIIRQK